MDNIQLSQKQLDDLASRILICDILSYIEENRSAYEEFLKNEKRKEVKDYDNRRIKEKITMDKLELQIV